MTGEGSLRRATCNGQVQGNERGTYTHCTSHQRQCGIAYQRRLSGRRSPHSTQLLGVTPETRGRGTGRWPFKGRRARDVREPEPEWRSSTGEPDALKGASPVRREPDGKGAAMPPRRLATLLQNQEGNSHV